MKTLIGTMGKFCRGVILCFSVLFVTQSHAVELVIGEEIVEPGIHFIFEGAVKDTITPAHYHLEESKTHVHIEARVNWADNDSIPEGTPAGGFGRVFSHYGRSHQSQNWCNSKRGSGATYQLD